MQPFEIELWKGCESWRSGKCWSKETIFGKESWIHFFNAEYRPFFWPNRNCAKISSTLSHAFSYDYFKLIFPAQGNLEPQQRLNFMERLFGIGLTYDNRRDYGITGSRENFDYGARVGIEAPWLKTRRYISCSRLSDSWDDAPAKDKREIWAVVLRKGGGGGFLPFYSRVPSFSIL